MTLRSVGIVFHFGVNTSKLPNGPLFVAPPLLRKLGVGRNGALLRPPAVVLVDDADSNEANAERVIGLGRSKKLGEASGDIWMSSDGAVPSDRGCRADACGMRNAESGGATPAGDCDVSEVEAMALASRCCAGIACSVGVSGMTTLSFLRLRAAPAADTGIGSGGRNE